MNTIPSELIAVPGFHGYFWHPQEEVLYSLKITGQLRPLKKSKSYWYGYNHFPEGFNVSRNGKSKRLELDQLRRLTPSSYKVPYANR
jgi:hypothetical protein